MMTQLIRQKVEQLAGEKHLVKERYTEIDDAIATQKHRILQEYEGLVAESNRNDEVIEERDCTLQALDEEERAMKAKYEKMLVDLKDRIKVVKLGQEKTHGELKQSKCELHSERRRYDKYLERDRERLGYAHNMLKARRLVHLSYANEMKRRHEKLGLGGAKAEEVSEAMAQAQAELRRMEALEARGSRKKATSNEPHRKKSIGRSNRGAPAHPYQNVKSRLHKSIESSRQKETGKYADPARGQRMEHKLTSQMTQNSQRKDQSLNASQFLSQSKSKTYAPGDVTSEQLSLLNSYKKLSTQLGGEGDNDAAKMSTMLASTNKREATETKIKKAKTLNESAQQSMAKSNYAGGPSDRATGAAATQAAARRKTVVFKQPQKHQHADQDKENAFLSYSSRRGDAVSFAESMSKLPCHGIGDGIGDINVLE